MVTKSMKSLVWIVISGMAVLITTASVFAFSLGKYEKVKPSGSVVTIATAKLTDGKVRYFKYKDGGKEIAFLAVKAPDGSIKTAFDACDTCYKEKKGYEQQGDKLNCKNCNQKFAINRLGPTTSGGCNPGYLPHQLNGNTISIQISDLKAGTKYF